MNEDRFQAAEQLLREVVYRSRERQAGFAALQAAQNTPTGTARPGLCGLGERAEVDLDLSPRGRELFERIFAADRSLDAQAPDVATPDVLGDIRTVMTAWIERQDALDRKRNHFLKDFRGRHGFDRSRYAPEILSDFDAGLERIRAEEDSARRGAAERLVRLAG